MILKKKAPPWDATVREPLQHSKNVLKKNTTIFCFLPFFLLYYGYMEKKVPCIYDYNDFRKFLKEYQTAKRSQDRRFTKSTICKLMGLPNSRSYFNDVLNGKHVSETYIERFITLFGFDADEARFFRVLVRFNQADIPSDRELLFEQLISLNKTPKKILSKDVYEYYTEWHHSAIRATMETIDFKADYAGLAKRIFPAITEKKAKESITLLKRLGLITPDKEGYLKVTDKSISAGSDIEKELLIQYHLKCLDAAKATLITNRTMHQAYSTNMISISKEGYERLKKRLQKFKSEVRSLTHKDEHPADRVYQLNIQLFPNTKQEKKNDQK